MCSRCKTLVLVQSESQRHPLIKIFSIQEWIPAFGRERIDLKSLMLLDEDDLREMHLPKGPIKTIMKAIQDRRKDIDEDSPIEDTQL